MQHIISSLNAEEVRLSWIAIKMLMGDRAKFLGIVMGLTFAALLINQQGSIFCGLMLQDVRSDHRHHGGRPLGHGSRRSAISTTSSRCLRTT